jgi:NitT/TauT family transport system ATP-binding protein
LLLLDEPFAALDEMTRFKLNEDLLRLWQAQHWTVVFVTHSVFESAFLSSRVIVMRPRPGRIIADMPIDLGYPRTSSLRTAPHYTELCRALSQRLAEGMAA